MFFTKAGLLAATLAGAVHGLPTRFASYQKRQNADDPFAILDPQNYTLPEAMTWSEFKAPPNTDWSNPSNIGSIRNFKIALVTVDFPDREFVVTQPAGSTIYDNPQPIVSDLAREDVPAYYHDLLNKPQALNHYHSLHEYWMEDSAGRYGVDLTAFGAYRLPAKSFQYGIDDEPNGFNPGACPETPCSVDLRTDAFAAWRADVGNATADSFELVFILGAGQDESSTWQEFGPIKFQNKEDVTDEFGPPANSSLPNYAKTRYVEWTSWASASNIWPNAGGGSSTQAESSGASTYAHELSHLLGIGDNYNNPYGTPARRAYAGPFSMLDRGSFNGPGGPHSRWQIPATQGATMGSLHTVRDKLQIGLTDNSSLLNVSKAALAGVGTVVAELTARSVDNPDGLMGLRIGLGGADLSPFCNVSTSPLCDGGGYDAYDLEIVDRMGQDSFTPDLGVMLSKTKNPGAPQPFQWVIDANPQDIGVVDYVRPNGEAVYYTVGDYRQLADALFHAGTRSGSEFEYVDEPNGLHFYVLARRRDDVGVLHYTVAARALAASRASTTYGVEIGAGAAGAVSEGGGSATAQGVTCVFELRNSGTTTFQGDAALAQYAKSDTYRLEAAVEGAGWRVELPNALAVVEFDASTAVSVAVGAAEDADASAVVTLTATSESDGNVLGSAECQVSK